MTQAGRTYCVTGAASGLGAAVTARLRGDGNTVITVDLEGVDVLADLSTERGRASAVHEISSRTDTLHGLVACAGLGPHVTETAAIVSVNYFGAVALLDGLVALLGHSGSGAAVAVASNAATTDPTVDAAILHACRRDDEVVARELSAAAPGHTVYASSKLALIRFVRASAAAWGAAGVRLNAIAPGAFQSPMADALLADPALGPLFERTPTPFGPRIAAIGPIVASIAFLLSADATSIHGGCLFADGGLDAIRNPEVP